MFHVFNHRSSSTSPQSPRPSNHDLWPLKVPNVVGNKARCQTTQALRGRNVGKLDWEYSWWRKPESKAYFACWNLASYTCAYIDTYIHTYMHTCIHAYMHTCIHAYIHSTLVFVRSDLLLSIIVSSTHVPFFPNIWSNVAGWAFSRSIR